MRNVRRVGFLCVVLASVGLPGCGTDPAGRVDLYEQQLARLQGALAQSDAKIVALQDAIDRGAALLSDPDLSDESDRAAIAKGVEQIRGALADAMIAKGKTQAWIEQTKASIEAAKAAGPVDLSGELGLIGQAVSQGGEAIGGKTGVYVGLAGLIVSLLGNVLQRAKGAALAATTRAIVQGVESAPQKSADDVKAAIEAKMKSAAIYDTANAIVDGFKG